MRKGARVRLKSSGELGVYLRRDMSRFLPFLVRFDNGTEEWLAAIHLETLVPGGVQVQ